MSSCGHTCDQLVPLYQAPEPIRRKYRECLTSKGTRKLIDVTVNRWASLVTQYWNEETQAWVDEFCLNKDPEDECRRTAMFQCTYVFANPNWGLQGTGYRSTSALAFNLEVTGRVFAATDHCMDQFWLASVGPRGGSRCTRVSTCDQFSDIVEEKTFDFGCFTIYSVVIKMRTSGTWVRQRFDTARLSAPRA